MEEMFWKHGGKTLGTEREMGENTEHLKVILISIQLS